MRIEKTLDIRDHLEGEIRATFAEGVRNQMTWQQINTRLVLRVWKHKSYARLANWAKSYLHGYQRAMMDSLYRDLLEWRVELDSDYVLDKDVPSGAWSRVNEGAYFWILSEKRFSDD